MQRNELLQCDLPTAITPDALAERRPWAAPQGSRRPRGGGFPARRLASLSTPPSPKRKNALRLVLLPIAALFVLLFASPASAAQQRPFEGSFGSAAQPTFGWSSSVAVDQQTGDVLVADADADGNFNGAIYRFHADGTAAPFEALGTNVIDGKGANGQPCATEPASCDETPQGKIEIGTSARESQIAIDRSGGATDGDIYLIQPGSKVVDIFGADGTYLGQLTGVGQSPFTQIGEPHGVAVDQSGSVFVAIGGTPGTIRKYEPSANPVVNSDAVENPRFSVQTTLRSLAVGAGSSAGLLFAVNEGEGKSVLYEFDVQTGELLYTLRSAGDRALSAETVNVDPNSGSVFVPVGFREIFEYQIVKGSEPLKLSRILASKGALGLGITPSDDVILAEGPQNPNVSVFGTPAVVPDVEDEAANNITGTKASFAGRVNPAGTQVEECFFEYGETSEYGSKAPCTTLPPADNNFHRVEANVSNLSPNGVQYHFRLVATNQNGREETIDRTFTTARTVVTGLPTSVGINTATLSGTLRPEGQEYSECFFEWGLSSSATFESIAPCEPNPAAIGSDYAPHVVQAPISGLKASTDYRYRLVATNGLGTLYGDEVAFTTAGAPRIGEVRAHDASQGSVVVEAMINPSGFGTSYHFEWGATTAYGNVVPPDVDPFIGSGTEPVLVKAKFSGLAAGTAYHYRVVARNSQGSVPSEDHVFETLNSCGLPDGRCVELVSPRDTGPVAVAGKPLYSLELIGQAGAQPGAVAYVVESGYPGATRGAELLYRSLRSPAGWTTGQLSPAIVRRDESQSAQSETSRTLGLSPDLSCGFVESTQPLTTDPGMLTVVEAGGKNLYRLNPDGSYTAVTIPTPLNFEKNLTNYRYTFNLIDFTADCGKAVFTTPYRYPGVSVPESGREYVYEWDHGAIRSVGIVPAPGGEIEVPADPGVSTQEINSFQVLSDDGSRVFFTAERQTSGNSEEVGKQALFVREDGAVTRDISLSKTGVPDRGAVYQGATPDGSQVYFTANAGLTTDSSGEGTDLYRYDMASGDLLDLSVDTEAGGAEVAGMVGLSDDGSHVYFAARGQLVPGKGFSYAQNEARSTYSLYDYSGGGLRFVGAIKRDDIGALIQYQSVWSSRVGGGGRYLLFESTAKVTGYESGGKPEAYIYDANSSGNPTACISCRTDGGSPIGGTPLLSTATQLGEESPIHPPQTLTLAGGQPRVVFTSRDALAPGAVSGSNNVYEWAHDQVFLIATEPANFGANLGTQGVRFLGADVESSDIYFASVENLTWEDGDQRSSIYDARIGGGFPQPAAAAPPCNPALEGSCSAAVPQPPVVPGAGSSSFVGPGNPKAKHKHSGKRHKKHRKKHRKHTKPQTHGKHETHNSSNAKKGTAK